MCVESVESARTAALHSQNRRSGAQITEIHSKNDSAVPVQRLDLEGFLSLNSFSNYATIIVEGGCVVGCGLVLFIHSTRTPV